MWPRGLLLIFITCIFNTLSFSSHKPESPGHKDQILVEDFMVLSLTFEILFNRSISTFPRIITKQMPSGKIPSNHRDYSVLQVLLPGSFVLIYIFIVLIIYNQRSRFVKRISSIFCVAIIFHHKTIRILHVLWRRIFFITRKKLNWRRYKIIIINIRM